MKVLTSLFGKKPRARPITPKHIRPPTPKGIILKGNAKKAEGT